MGICWRRSTCVVLSMILQLNLFSLLSLLEYCFAYVLRAFTKIYTGSLNLCVLTLKLLGFEGFTQFLMFDLFLVSSIQMKTTKVSEHPGLRKVSVFTGRSGADLSQAAFSSPSQGGKLSSSALVVPVSISAIEALLQPLPGHCSSVIPGKSASVFPWSFHRTSQEHLASLFLVTPLCW